ncbi:asparagine synthase-related protein [Sphingomonas glacialis]|uniref:asparagine synthase-related protein n=1 Tax=Sphingomonas glacialis TaxID=658225 RepID=UPI001E28B2DB|nr:asparagine synthase-related protein [Sphingomonas glacialis]
MATRFLAVIPHAGRASTTFAQGLRKKTGFAVAVDEDALTLLVEHIDGVVTTDQDGCAVVGWLFGREDYRVRTVVDSLTSQAMANADFKRLLNHYWGGYIAFAKRAGDRAISVLRDPSGGLPCYYQRTPHATFLFSDMATWRAAEIGHTEIDWTGVAWRLAAANLPTSRTALDQIDELGAGFNLLASDYDAIPQIAWTPWEHVDPPSGPASSDLAGALRETVLRSVAAWAVPFRNVLLNLSGGLDSSIIAAGLAERSNRAAALTMATRSPSGDERRYARSVAHATDLKLIESFYEADDVDIALPSLPDLPRPTGRIIGQAFEAARRRTAALRGADAFFTGLGGDNVFCFLQSPTPLADQLKAQGLTPALRETLDSVCMQTGCSITTALWWAVQRAWMRPPRYRWQRHALFLDPACLPRASDLTHPWLTAPTGALPGKAAHIAMLMRVQAERDCFARGSAIPIIAPLLSQPIMELCLSIPTWLWSAGGRDRAVARDAFAGLLPAMVVDRRSKAGPEAFCYEIIARDRDRLRAHLLDGELAANGILDRSAIENVLREPAPPSGDHFLRLLELADAEAWVRHWSRAS